MNILTSDEFSLFDNNLDEIKYVSNVIQYQGFNPVEFKKYLESFEPDVSIRNKDLTSLIVIYINRGTKSESIMNRTSEQGKIISSHLLRKYKVTDNIPRNSTDVTLARIGACFPILCALSIKNGLGRIVGFVPANLPYFLAFPSGASLIPHSMKEVFESWKEWRKDFGLIINASTPKADYDKITWDSQLYTDNERENFIEKLNK